MKWPFPKMGVEGGEGFKGFEGPVFEIEGKRTGKTLLVTGGMDGDEYTGMEAAYRLREKYQGGDFAGRLIIIPIVNLSGFDGECSWNPEDKRFPKHLYPGDANGSPTAKLVDWLVTKYVAHADVWHDLHAGAITEGLRPFVWLYETGVREVDAFADELMNRMDAERFVFERAGVMSKAAQLAKQGRAYILAESGERGSRDEASILRHVAWVESTMAALGMIEDATTRNATNPKVFTQVIYDHAPFDGIWRPIMPVAVVFRRGDVIGTCARLDGSGQEAVRASTDGTALWWKETMRIKKGEMILALGC